MEPWRRSTRRWRLRLETGAYVFDTFLHRVRGNILLKRDPANTMPVEQAFLTAIEIARQHGLSQSWPSRGALACQTLPINWPPKPTQSSPPPSKALRRRRKCRRLGRRWN